MNYYPHHIGDFRSGTVNMSRQSRWIYRDMLDIYYDTEKPLPSDLDILCDMLGIESDEERRLVERLLRFKFIASDDGFHHERCDTEIAEYHRKAEIAKTNGKAGGRPRKPKGNPEKPSGFQSGFNLVSDGFRIGTGLKTNQEPITNNQDIKEYPPTPRKRGASFDASEIELPEWLNSDDWNDWIADRKARKKPVTEAAARLQLKQLADYLAEGHRPDAVIAHSIAGGYQGLFPPRVQARASPVSKAQSLANWSDELRDVLTEDSRPAQKFMGVIDATH